MGGEQSIPRGGDKTAPAPTETRKTCYYELLGVDRQATDDEIRKAYKRKALELHPDRNINDTENATFKFAQVQNAYEVLSDPQERAWYDSHRDAILDGDDDVVSKTNSDQAAGHHTSSNAIFSLMGRFNSRLPMDDSENGFFGILNGFFLRLGAEENAACESENIPAIHYPVFGWKDDDYQKVAKPFYSVWSSFSTRKSFTWLDKHRLSEAPDRRIRRLMEKENKKFREEGIREFNDAVLSLVAFVKKRDPRYVPNTQTEAERQQTLRDLAAAQAQRSRQVNQQKAAEYVVPEWAQNRNDADDNDEFYLSEEKSEVEEIECVICNKTFKSEKQYEAHEKSKKHVKAIQQLKWEMRKQNMELNLEEETSAPEAHLPGDKDPVEGSDENDAVSVHGALPSSSKAEVIQRAGGLEPGPSEDEPDGPEEEEKGTTSSPATDEDDEYAPRSKVEERIANGPGSRNTVVNEKRNEASTPETKPKTATPEDAGTEAKTSGQKIGKAKLKREKKAARQAAEAVTQDSLSQHKCTVCGEVFASRSKLFSHIRDLDHAVPLPTIKTDKKKRR